MIFNDLDRKIIGALAIITVSFLGFAPSFAFATSNNSNHGYTGVCHYNDDDNDGHDWHYAMMESNAWNNGNHGNDFEYTGGNNDRDGWCNDHGTRTATLVASKIVCDSEADLPDWGRTSPSGPSITSSTATAYVNSHPSCHIVNDWQFEWSPGNTPNPGDNTIGTTGGIWKSFTGSTAVNLSNLGDRIWVREVNKNGYMLFSGAMNTNSKSVSPEMYCNSDVLNFDNYERIDSPQKNQRYYCVAFNVLKTVPPVDVCPNITGNQATIPSGYHKEGNNCVQDPIDVCPNIAGSQATVPTGYHMEGNQCVQNPVDVCPNLEGAQATIPNGYHKTGENCIADDRLATIVANKIVCDNESDLPNWAAKIPATITSSTASNYVASHPSCRLVNNWQFQWAPSNTSNPGDNSGEAGGGWTTFTGSVSVNLANVGSLIWVREIPQSGHVPFTGLNTTQNVSAEMYCHSDGLNYDNYDYVGNPQNGGTYYCVGFNALIPVPPTDVCPNIAGTQSVLPEGYHMEGNNCVQNPVDVCPNDAGVQTTTPCPSQDVCPLIDGIQLTTELCPAVVDVCPNDAGVQTTTPCPSQDVCPDVQGIQLTTELCPPPVDMCPDIEGVQLNTELCPTIVDVCPNDAGVQTTTPCPSQDVCPLVEGIQLTTELCPAVVDVCPNLEGTQASIPSGYHFVGETCIADSHGSNNPPTITLIGTDATLSIDTHYFDEGATANDIEDGDLTPEIQINGIPANTSVVGDYDITYTVEDSDHNVVTVHRTLHVVNAPVLVVNPPTTTGGGGGSRHRPPTPQGRVLGASTECGIYLSSYIKYGENNNPDDVMKLQSFLNEWMGANVPNNGTYDKATYEALKKFQLKYKNDILEPWVKVGLHTNEDTPTGFVYRTTQRQINNIMCPALNLPLPDLSSETATHDSLRN